MNRVDIVTIAECVSFQNVIGEKDVLGDDTGNGLPQVSDGIFDESSEKKNNTTPGIVKIIETKMKLRSVGFACWSDSTQF